MSLQAWRETKRIQELEFELARSLTMRYVTDRWEQTTAFYLDSDEYVVAFVKNFNLGFAIPYSHNGEAKEYLPDFLVRLQKRSEEIGTLILETKGYDPLARAKEAGAHRWVAAVNAEGSHGRWAYRLIKSPADTPDAVRMAAEELAQL
ncbi:MAG: hypothetical protein ACE5JD_02750 [Candidatus Methylomirabilia bacterium]